MRARGGLGPALAATLCGLTMICGCATRGPRLEGGLYRAPDGSYEIGAPPGLGERWRSADVEGAELAFEGLPGGPAASAALSLLVRCDGPRAEPRYLARALLIGLEGRRFDEDRALRVAGAPGWRQQLRATSGGRSVELRTVTRVSGRCTTDFVLVAPAVGPRPAEDFEAWWQSYRPLAGGAPGEVSSEARVP